jgi:hypothetical protein
MTVTLLACGLRGGRGGISTANERESTRMEEVKIGLVGETPTLLEGDPMARQSGERLRVKSTLEVLI